MINVLVADDQNLIHRLVEGYLKPENEIKIVGFAENGQEAIEKTANLQPDIVLMDVEMPKIDGLAATKIITEKFLTTKVLILTVHDNEHHLSQALKNGAKGYLLKTTTAQELKNAIFNVNQGYFQLSIELTEKYLQKIIRSNPDSNSLFEIGKKVNYLYKSYKKLGHKLENIQINDDDLEEKIIQKVDQLLQKEMTLIGEHDSNLQYKVDRMKHNQERLEQSVQYLFTIQLASILVLLGIIIFVAFSKLI
ncbi:response regulator transcription factor [Pleurocapsa sp. PCC 7319]|uniref:response regulator n=1 Tax=Pleurocapsa sp. PCC 7319 TaxID=118161 RepID=UPI000344EB1F|nr:response regulator transcription factor [Pleurocapsa sp. PCC 7319]